MAISSADIKNLREQTGAGMMDCKKALEENNGDFEKAIEFLRKKGLAAAAKKQARVAAEGLIASFINPTSNIGALVEVNCETDFVAKNEDFKSFVNTLSAHVIGHNAKDVEELESQRLANTERTVKETVNDLTLKIGEKISIRRFAKYTLPSSGIVSSYVHFNNKIGVLTEVSCEKEEATRDDSVKEFVKNLGMHIVACDPKFLKATEMDEGFKNKEAEIYAAQLKEQGKPEKMIEGIVKGKLQKLATEVCLYDQKYVLDSDKSVSDVLKELSNKTGSKIEITRFLKYTLGEGIQKKEDNLADEVAKMTQK